ncbi:hypothetical protein BABINDRAFT_162334 [Babjeviella inositovora NRRL Y-12698]|uniref:Mitochondrial group I intron splicing factor CCM1 n=1 Tax=Babjeviella inositovora NRRL Y-12698 TaxID=984486 RepID=A0A1E3QNF2_9ASCO|nr:uncharacterized protein BABINDRAFT_162334 [Babjeviella inositovora NRRL Y-12698]ODQ78622.1 hypothetical protein BABINDRAFT_162334 [Babjeviella inositovora NRRL Y-12698]
MPHRPQKYAIMLLGCHNRRSFPVLRHFRALSVQFPQAEDGLLAKALASTFQKYLRQKVIYDTSPAKRLYPTLNDALVAVLIDNEARRTPSRKFAADMTHWGFFRSPKGLPPSLEVLVSYILYCVHYCCTPSAISATVEASAQRVTEIMDDNLLLMAQEFLQESASWEDIRSDPSQAVSLVSFYKYQSSDVLVDSRELPPPFLRTLQNCIAVFQLFSPAPPLFTSLSAWIASITAPTVTAACKRLAGMTDIPAFVMVDILQRNAKSTLELELLLQIYEMHAQEVHLVFEVEKPVLVNLIRSCMLYNSRRASKVLSHYLPLVDASSPAQRQFLNELMYEATKTTPANPHPGLPAHVFEVHQAIASILAQKSVAPLAVEGFLGLTTSVAAYSHTQSAKSLGYCEELIAASPQTPQLDVYYLVTKLKSSVTIDDVIKNFQFASEYNGKAYHMYPELWSELVAQLARLGLLNRKRAANLLQQIADLRIAIPSTMLSKLLSRLVGFQEMDNHVQRLYLPEASVASYLIRAYTDCIRNTNGCLNEPYRQFASFLDYTRYLYRSIVAPTTSHIGMMLFGEMHFQPERVFTLYELEYAKHGAEFPDERALYVLLSCASRNMKPRVGHREEYDSNKPHGMLMWGDKYAVQVAMAEFKRSVRTKMEKLERLEECPNDHLVYPSNNLWRAYLEVLVKFGYSEELTYVLSWWEDLEFVPSEHNLATLLVALPDGQAEALIRDVAKNHAVPSEVGGFSLALWPWPTVAMLEAFRLNEGRG